MNHREFKLTTPIWSLSDAATGGDSLEIEALYRLLDIVGPGQSLMAKYDSFNDPGAAKKTGDLWGRSGRGNVILLLGTHDDDTFIAVDMFAGAADSMDRVVLGVRCRPHHAEDVNTLLRDIRSLCASASAITCGSLGLGQEYHASRFPRPVNDESNFLQELEIFRNGSVLE